IIILRKSDLAVKWQVGENLMQYSSHQESNAKKIITNPTFDPEWSRPNLKEMCDLRSNACSCKITPRPDMTYCQWYKDSTCCNPGDATVAIAATNAFVLAL